MIPTDRLPTHPGEILREEFLVPLGMTQAAFARHLGLSAARIGAIVRGVRPVTPELAWLFAAALGTSAEFWTNLQVNFDLAAARPVRSVVRIPRSA